MKQWLPAVLILMASCTTTKKAIRYFNAHPDKAESYCMGAFPIKVEVDTVFVVSRDSAVDSAYNALVDYADSLASLPASYLRDTIRIMRLRRLLRPPDTVVHTIVRTYENRALINQLRGQIHDMQLELNDYSVKVDNRNKILASIGSLLVGLVGIYFRRKTNA